MEDFDAETLVSVFATPNQDGSFPDETRDLLQRLGTKRKLVFMAFPPKAAGTFLRTAVICAVGGQLVRIAHAQGGRDATPYLPTFVYYYMGGITDKILVSHSHMLALPSNINFLETFGICPVIIKRSIPDMLISYGDNLDTEDVALREGLNCHIPENFRSLPPQQRGDFLVDVLGPWYANYYAGWLAYAETHPDRICVLSYGEVKEDMAGAVLKIAAASGILCSRDNADAAVQETWEARANYRFNKGVNGRGKSYFSEEQLARLERCLGYYPALDPYHRELMGQAPAKAAA